MINPRPASSVIKDILSYPNESKTVEFKISFPWPQDRDEFQANDKAQEVVTSILGMSNGRDPGRIIIGVKRDSTTQTYTSVGMNGTHLQTYDQDLIYEQIRNFGTPEPKFEVNCEIFDEKQFIVFSIGSFTISPVFAVNTWKLSKMEEGAIYIRTDKPETKKITDPYEMKELFDIGIDKEITNLSPRIRALLQALKEEEATGFKIVTDFEKFQRELEDLTNGKQ